MWEDEANKLAGKWFLRVNKGFSNKLGEDLTLAMIGEQFEAEDDIHGLVITVRPNGDTISLWNKNSRDSKVVESIRRDMVKFMSLSDEISLEYKQFFPE